MTTIREKEILVKAIKKFGRDKQLDMVIEECSELIKAILKLRRKKNNENYSNVLEEIADVSIMLAQIKIMFDNDEMIENIKSDKLMRLENTLYSLKK